MGKLLDAFFGLFRADPLDVEARLLTEEVKGLRKLVAEHTALQEKINAPLRDRVKDTVLVWRWDYVVGHRSDSGAMIDCLVTLDMAESLKDGRTWVVRGTRRADNAAIINLNADAVFQFVRKQPAYAEYIRPWLDGLISVDDIKADKQKGMIFPLVAGARRTRKPSKAAEDAAKAAVKKMSKGANA